MTEQLLDLEAVQRTLRDELRRDDKDIPLGGAERLLTALCKHTDLDPRALTVAARLCAALDEPKNGNGKATA